MGLFGKNKPFFTKCRELVNSRKGAAVQRDASGNRQQNAREAKADEPQASNRIAVFGDVHANLEALEAVLKDAEQLGITQFACTGDLVGYGPNPSECLEIVKALGCPVVKGNHDEYAATDISLKDFTLHAMNALIWTREHLTDGERAWLDGLPMEVDVTTKYTEDTQKGIGGSGSVPTGDDTEVVPPKVTTEYAENTEPGTGGTTSSSSIDSGKAASTDLNNHQSPIINAFHLVHSSVFEPAHWKYIIKPEEAEKVLPLQQQNLVFFGHTHIPSAYAFNPETGECRSTVPLPEGKLVLESGWKWLVNPGSVGQPRDKDPRAAYMILDPEAGTVEQRRVEYDFEITADKILDAGLPERNAERLYKGR